MEQEDYKKGQGAATLSFQVHALEVSLTCTVALIQTPTGNNMASRLSLLLLLIAILLLFIVQVSSDHSNVDGDHEYETQAVVKGPNRRLLPYLNCEGLCNQRCRAHSRPNVCTRACGTCCVRCKCVPPGTAGNREVCGRCYTDMTTHGNRLKCP